MILCVGATPALQRVMVFPRLEVDGVNRAATTLEGIAGKSINMAKVLRALGEEPFALGFVGGQRGKQLRQQLAALGLLHGFVEVPPETRQCITVIDGSRETITELVEESRAVPGARYEELLAMVKKLLGSAKPHPCRAIVMSGTLTPKAPADFYLRCVRLANEAGILSVLDAKGPPLLRALKARPGLVKPNREELAATVGHQLKSERALLLAMRKLHRMGAQRVVVTAGKGSTLAFDGERFWRIRSPKIVAINPIGSGDSFTAGVVWRLVRGDDLGEACRWGAAAGAANALTLMAAEVSMKEVRKLATRVVIDPI